MSDDWFRRKTWTPKDREEFFGRLRRSRGARSKAQYARIQAYELLTTRTPEAYLAALELLDTILVEWREDAQLASVYHHCAECYVGLVDLPRAIDAYHQVFETQRVRKGELTMAHLDFGWLVATTPLPNLYDEALALLGEFRLTSIERARFTLSFLPRADSASRHEATHALRFRPPLLVIPASVTMRSSV
jgi:hypothetical protein